mmetsp:Transcript_27224/g.63914  ORF Transcript_27224/g.63914 Transcript_27224/m.63914 type:complete len:201 (+) Transcript_27224:224-826(+)
MHPQHFLMQPSLPGSMQCIHTFPPLPSRLFIVSSDHIGRPTTPSYPSDPPLPCGIFARSRQATHKDAVALTACLPLPASVPAATLSNTYSCVTLRNGPEPPKAGCSRPRRQPPSEHLQLQSALGLKGPQRNQSHGHPAGRRLCHCPPPGETSFASRVLPHACGCAPDPDATCTRCILRHFRVATHPSPCTVLAAWPRAGG